MDWSDSQVVRLRELWAEEHSTAEIGRRMNLSKSAIVGKAHRLDLPGRDSPIHRQGEPAPSRVPHAPKVTLAPLESLAAPVPASRDGRPTQISTKRPTPVETLPPLPRAAMEAIKVHAKPVITTPVKAVEPPPKPFGRVATCSDVQEVGPFLWKYCDLATLPGKPYCEEHNKGRTAVLCSSHTN